MGPRETMPAFAPPPWAPERQGDALSIVKSSVDCNWAQVLEGAIDSAHSSTPALVGHGAGARRRREGHGVRVAAAVDRQGAAAAGASATDYGFSYAAIRRPISNAATNDYMRITVFVAPVTVLIPPNNLYNVANINVPIDDTHTMFYFIAWNEDEPPASTRKRGASSARRRWASTSTPSGGALRTLAQPLPGRTGRR